MCRMRNGGADTRDDPHRQGTCRTFAPWTDPTACALVRFDGVSKQFLVKRPRVLLPLPLGAKA